MSEQITVCAIKINVNLHTSNVERFSSPDIIIFDVVDEKEQQNRKNICLIYNIDITRLFNNREIDLCKFIL